MRRFNEQMTTVATDELTAFNRDGFFRAVEWENRPAEVMLQHPENDNALLEFTRKAPLTKQNKKNPFVWYTVDGALTTYTNATAASAYNATTITMEDSYVFVAGGTMVNVNTGDEMLVVSVNNTTHVVTVDRDYLGVAGSAIAVGDEFRSLLPATGELGRAKETYTTVPGDPEYNCISLGLWKTGISDMQRNAAMEGDWGTWDFLMASAQYQAETAAQNSLLFQHRTTTSGAINSVNEGMIYRGAGFIEQLSDQILDLGSSGATGLAENLSEFIDPMFQSKLSANKKDVFAGAMAFNNLLQTARQNGSNSEVSIDASVGAMSFTMLTNGGNTVQVNRVNGFKGEMAEYALILDANNIGAGEYEGLGAQWIMDTQEASAVIEKEATYLLSFEAHIYDRSTCGLIKASQNSLLG